MDGCGEEVMSSALAGLCVEAETRLLVRNGGSGADSSLPKESAMKCRIFLSSDKSHGELSSSPAGTPGVEAADCWARFVHLCFEEPWGL